MQDNITITTTYKPHNNKKSFQKKADSGKQSRQANHKVKNFKTKNAQLNKALTDSLQELLGKADAERDISNAKAEEKAELERLEKEAQEARDRLLTQELSDAVNSKIIDFNMDMHFLGKKKKTEEEKGFRYARLWYTFSRLVFNFLIFPWVILNFFTPNVYMGDMEPINSTELVVRHEQYLDFVNNFMSPDWSVPLTAINMFYTIYSLIVMIWSYLPDEENIFPKPERTSHYVLKFKKLLPVSKINQKTEYANRASGTKDPRFALFKVSRVTWQKKKDVWKKITKSKNMTLSMELMAELLHSKTCDMGTETPQVVLEKMRYVATSNTNLNLTKWDFLEGQDVINNTIFLSHAVYLKRREMYKDMDFL